MTHFQRMLTKLQNVPVGSRYSGMLGNLGDLNSKKSNSVERQNLQMVKRLLSKCAGSIRNSSLTSLKEKQTQAHLTLSQFANDSHFGVFCPSYSSSKSNSNSNSNNISTETQNATATTTNVHKQTTTVDVHKQENRCIRTNQHPQPLGGKFVFSPKQRRRRRIRNLETEKSTKPKMTTFSFSNSYYSSFSSSFSPSVTQLLQKETPKTKQKALQQTTCPNLTPPDTVRVSLSVPHHQPQETKKTIKDRQPQSLQLWQTISRWRPKKNKEKKQKIMQQKIDQLSNPSNLTHDQKQNAIDLWFRYQPVRGVVKERTIFGLQEMQKRETGKENLAWISNRTHDIATLSTNKVKEIIREIDGKKSVTELNRAISACNLFTQVKNWRLGQQKRKNGKQQQSVQHKRNEFKKSKTVEKSKKR